VEAGADVVDLNMACPVRKVVKTGAGVALLGDPDRAAAIVAEMVDAVEGRIPVTVKIRSGLREGDEAASTRGRRASSIEAAPTTRSRSLWPRSSPSP
jgi:tRNA-dihydrouridine synthase